MRAWLTAACVAVVALPCAAAEELTASELESQLVGAAIVWHATDGALGGELFLHESGAAELRVSLPWEAEDQGRWHLSGNRLCTEWQRLRNKESKCYTVRKTGEGRFETSGGNVFELAAVGV